MPKIPAAERRARIEQVAEWVAAGNERAAIVDLCAEVYDVAKPTADVYLREGRALLAAEATNAERREQLAIAVRRYNALFKAAFDAGKWTAATQAQNSLVRLLGLDRHFSVHDLERILKAEALLTGAPTEIVEVAPAEDGGLDDEVRSDPRGVVLRLAAGDDAG